MAGGSERGGAGIVRKMMRKTLWLGAAMCVAVLAGAQKAAEPDATTTILGLEHVWFGAQAHNDNAALNLIFDERLTYLEYGRLVTKGEYLSRIKQARPEKDVITPEPIAVHVFGSTAVVVGTYREKQANDGHTSLARWRFVDTWVYKKSGWVLVAAGAAPIS